MNIYSKIKLTHTATTLTMFFNKYRSVLKRLASLFIVAAYVFTSFSGVTKAISNNDITDIINNSAYYDPRIDTQQCIQNSTGQSPTKVNQSIYILGDSYGDGYEASLTAKLKAQSFNDIVFNHSVSRAIDVKGQNPKTSGLDAVETDKDKIAGKGVIVIQLGTNPESDFKAKHDELLKNLQKINSTAKYYWVNVGNYDKFNDKDANDVINDNPVNFNYQVIDWKSKADEKYFTTADGKVHPSQGTGWEDYASVIAGAVNVPQAASSNSTGAVVPGIYMTDQSKKNPERIWQFLMAPEGLLLNAKQAAGVMGNIRQEAGVNYGPTAVQAGGGGGYGIVQWTSGGRKKNYEAFKNQYLGKNPMANSANQGTNMDLMDVQLNFMKHELVNSYKETLELLKSSDENTLKSSMGISDAVVAAAVIFHGTSHSFDVPGIPFGKGYEASGDSLEKVKNVRGQQFGYEALNTYGADDSGPSAAYGALSLATDSNGCISSTPLGSFGSAVEGGWDLTAMTLYNQGSKNLKNDPWIDDEFTCGSLGKCGCPVISAAVIISTLTSKKVDPGMLLKDQGKHNSWSSVPTRYGLERKELEKDFTKASKILEEGGLVMVHVNSGSNFAGTTWRSGHYFVIRKFQDGKFFVYTLYGTDHSEANTTGYTPDDFVNGRLDKMWGYTKK